MTPIAKGQRYSRRPHVSRFVPTSALKLTSNTSAPETARVLHVISGLFYGGGQRVVVDLLRELPAATERECRLCTLGSGTILDSLADTSIPYDGRYNSPKTLWRAARSLRRIMREQHIDVVHTHGVDADLIGALAVRGSSIGQVCHLHVMPPTDSQGSWKSRARRRLLRVLTNRRLTLFVAVSDAVRRQMSVFYRLPLERIVTVRNGVNVPEFAQVDRRPASERIVIGGAGRLEPLKGFDHLLEAARLLTERHVPFELQIAGGGRMHGQLQAQAQAAGIDRHVTFLGQITDMSSFYQGLDVFVLPSLSEGMPLVVLEAMSTGAPVVTTQLPGVPEIIEDGVTGILVPPGDAGALANALQRLAGDGELRRRIGIAGADRVRSEFTVERAAAEIATVYERLTASSGRSGS